MLEYINTYTVDEFRDTTNGVWYHRVGPVEWFVSMDSFVWVQVSEDRCNELEALS